MRPSIQAAVATALAAAAVTASSSSLATLCAVSNVQAALPANGTLIGINLIPSSVTANVVYNATSGGGVGANTASTGTTYSYCNVTVQYVHTGHNTVLVWYSFPDPATFKNRFYIAGGGGYTISTTPTGGLSYGAVSGSSDAGYNGFSTSYDDVNLYGNGSINWDNAYMFSYQALGETAIVGKAITLGFYDLSVSTKIYTYFEGCSDGGREAMSQVQRYGEVYDGIVAGAPAFRFAQQQINHLFSVVAEQTLDYYPAPCELAKIVNATIAACDSLDGRTDGVVSRTDLCIQNFNLTSIIGESYYCAAVNSSSLGFAYGQKHKRQAGSTASDQPAQSGNISAEAVALAQRLYEGMFNSEGERIYFPWQTASGFNDAGTAYSSTTGQWKVSIPGTGGVFVTKFVELVDIDNLSSLNNVTYDTLQAWMQAGMIRYMDSLQTTVPDLTPFYSNGGKLIHYHGESDDSVPPASSVHYWQSVRSIMYPTLSFNDSVTSLSSWYKFFLVPGAAHCGTNTLQPGPWPSSNMATMIDWVENGVEPTTLNATVTTGSTYAGESQPLCPWPSRPYWSSNGGNGTSLSCEYSQESIDSWTYTLDAFKLPVY